MHSIPFERSIEASYSVAKSLALLEGSGKIFVLNSARIVIKGV